ncbi:MAG: hypothetical protein H5T74_01625 [Actinobacteria bacterium]|nr:hypothetical protein [Actinomycetota bacterium]
MRQEEYPRVSLLTHREPPRGLNIYQPLPELVEFRRLEKPPSRVRTIGLGRLVVLVDGEGGELVGLQSYVKTGRWKSEGTEAPPLPDARGVLAFPAGEDTEELAFFPAEPRYLWHDETASLRIAISGETALVFEVADCLLAGVDREGRLTDFWLLDLDLRVG